MSEKPTYEELKQRIQELEQAESESKQAEKELQKVSSIMQQSFEGIAVADLGDNLLFVNHAWSRMHGFETEEELIGKSLNIFHNREQLENDVIPFNQKVMENGFHSGEIGHIRKGGTPFPTLMNTPLIKDEHGKPYAIAGIARDITERKQAEEFLKQEKERAETYLNIAGVIMVALNSQGIVTMINRKGCDILGYDEADILGKNWFDNFIPERTVSSIRLVSEQLFLGEMEKGEFFENPVLTRGGEERLVAWHNTAIRNNEGEITGLLSSGEDITDRKKAEDALKESGVKFREMTELLPEIVYECDAQGDITFVNKAGLKKYGITQEDIDKGAKTQQFLAPIDRKRAGENLGKILRGIEKGPFEYTAQRKDGSEFPIISYSSPIIRDGKPVGNRGICVDITERKQAEEALNESNQFLDSVLESIQDGISVLNIDLTIRYANQVMNNWYSAKTPLEGKKCFQCYQNRSEPCAPCPTLRCIKTGKTEMDIVPGLPGSGVEWIELYSYPIKGPNSDKVTGAVEFVRDITKRKQVEEKLRKSEEKFRLLADYTYDWEYWINKDGKSIYISPSCERITGYSPDDFLNNPELLFDLVHPDYAKMIYGHDHNEDEKLKPLCTMEFSIINRNGEVRWIGHNCTPVFDDQGQFIGRRGSNRDITERRQSEEAGARLEEQYHQAQKVESIGRLAGGVAHDLNNLLTPILGYSEMLMDDLGPDDKRQESVGEILKAGFRARDLVRQLLAFGRKQTLEYRPVDPNLALTGFEKLLRRTIREDIEIEIIPSPDIRTVMADIGQIEQVIMNLAVNAQDAMPEGGRLTIETAMAELDEEYAATHQSVKPGKYVMLAISDTGCGMDEETREHIFEPFFSTKGELGTGMGLATVYGIIKQHGGNVWVYSEPGKGSAFKIYLPVSGEALIEEETSEKTAAGAKGLETILLVEDNKLVRDLSSAILKRQGYTVLVAENGPEALTILAAHDDPADLLLTDVVMPGMNGRDLFDKVAEKHPDTKVLYMSGYTDNTIAHHGVLDEGVFFIQKPFNVQGLADKVREVLEQGSDG